MLLLILIVAIVVAVMWWLNGERTSSRNERLYLERRGYEPPSEVENGSPVPKDARLFNLIESLSDISPFARQRAAEDLSRMCVEGNRDSRMLSALVDALDDSDASVRSAAAVALGNLGDADATEALTRRLEEEESVHARAAVERSLQKLS
ncbi:MAG TPA: HEAT repeat domain-containing protein [Blastocatellia bacterium]|nr:HEAT repeat domain-containing protein [Blastocatellia bacterium]